MPRCALYAVSHAARLTIALGDEALKALRLAKTISVALNSGGRSAPASQAAPVGKAKSNGKPGPYRAGSLPATLLGRASGRKRPFGVTDLMKKFRIKRGHASMLLAYVTRGGALSRVGRAE